MRRMMLAVVLVIVVLCLAVVRAPSGPERTIDFVVTALGATVDLP